MSLAFVIFEILWYFCDSGAVGTTFFDELGLNQIADANNIVVLYPQAEFPGEFNWWGANGDANYSKLENPSPQSPEIQ